MLKGDKVCLRTFRSRDLEPFLDLHSDVKARGDHFPMVLFTETSIKQRFDKDGYWSEDNGCLLMVDPVDDRILGMMAFFKPVFYYSALEVGYIVFRPEDRGKGYTHEAMTLFIQYLFASKPVDRLQLQIEPDNIGSTRIAEKSGFTLEGRMRQAILAHGRHVDINVYSLLRSEFEASKPGE